VIDDAGWPRPPRPGPPFRHPVGVRGVDEGEWLRPRPGDAGLLAWKARCLAEAGDWAFLALPGSEAGGVEALDVVAAAAGREPAPPWTPAAGHPLLAASLLVAEDLCLLDVTGDEPVLVAGSVTMPSRWLLGEKVGRNLLGVHDPVPGYAAEIGRPTDRLLQRLSGGRILARTTWALTDDPSLFQPAETSRIASAKPEVRSAADAAERLSIRVEYQTVRPLPASGTVLFTIRTARERLGRAAGAPWRADAMLALLTSMPPEQLDYKGVAPYEEHVVAFLRQRAAA
jgi:dimethylamine monooxygenase subunit A